MKIRKSIKYTSILISIILIIISMINIINNLSGTNSINKSKEIYNYTNKFNYEYNVNLLDNKYIDTSNMSKSHNDSYVTKLINNINLNFNYNYNASEISDIKYEYKIVGKLSAVYTKDGVENKIWEKEDILKESTSFSTNSDSINIKDSILLDINTLNSLVTDFEDEMEMGVTANYTVMLEVNTNTNIEEQEVVNEYTPVVTISLGEKVTKISGENNLENKEYVSKQINELQDRNIYILIINIIVLGTGIMLFTVSIKHKTANVIRNEYRYELNRILKMCQDKIVKVSENQNIEDGNIIDVKDFGEILKVSEELFKPILYFYDEEKEEAIFSIISNKVTYRYILKK